MAESAAIDAGVEPVRITRAAERLLSGANCEGEDLAKVALAQVLAKQLEALLMVLVADAVKGRADLPLVIQPAMLVASHLAALLQAGTEAAGGTPAGSTADRVREAAAGLKGAAEVLEELAGKAKAAENYLARDR